MRGGRLVAMAIVVAATAGAGQAADAPAVVRVTDVGPLIPTLTRNGRAGRYEMTVASTGHGRQQAFLNSKVDYTDRENVTFTILPTVAKTLLKRYGAPPEGYFKGRTLTVDGILTIETVMGTLNGQPHDVRRNQLVVQIRQASQIVAVR